MIMQWGENPERFKNQSISKVLLFSIAFKKATTLRCVHAAQEEGYVLGYHLLAQVSSLSLLICVISRQD